MNTKELIGREIKDILVWTKMEVGGLDEAEVFIVLDNGRIISIPWDFDSDNIERIPNKTTERLFADLNDIPIYYINPEGKKIGEVLEAKKKRESSLIVRIKKLFGIKEGIPKEYKPHKKEYQENKIKHLKNQKIVDFLIVEEYDSVGFLELENGFIITEITTAPHGTGKAGLHYYESLKDFEDRCGTDYKKMINKD